MSGPCGEDVRDMYMVIVERMRLVGHTNYLLTMEEFLDIDLAPICGAKEGPFPTSLRGLEKRDVKFVLELLTHIGLIVHDADHDVLKNWVFFNPRWYAGLPSLELSLCHSLTLSLCDRPH